MEVKCCGNGWGRKPCLMGTDGDGYNFCGNGWGWFDFPLPCRSLVPLHRRKKERKKERKVQRCNTGQTMDYDCQTAFSLQCCRERSDVYTTSIVTLHLLAVAYKSATLS